MATRSTADHPGGPGGSSVSDRGRAYVCVFEYGRLCWLESEQGRDLTRLELDACSHDEGGTVFYLWGEPLRSDATALLQNDVGVLLLLLN